MAETTTPVTSGQKILSIDIGGSNVKAVLLDAAGQNLTEYEKLATPVPATPERVMVVIEQLAQRLNGLGIASGKGFEIVATLGTGFGTAFLKDGILLPHIEVGQHPVSKDRTYDQYIGDKAMIEAGEEKWNRRMRKVLDLLKSTFNYDHLYLGGGNAKKIKFQLDENVTMATNRDGIKGGARLWN